MPYGATDSLYTPVTALPQDTQPVLIQKDTMLASSLFPNHSLQSRTKDLRIQEHTDSHQAWIATVLLICFGLFAWLKGARSNRLSQIFHAILSNSTVNRAFRSEYATGSGTSIVLSIIYLSVYALFIGQLLGYKNVFMGSLHPFVLFLLIISMVFTIYLGKLLLIKVCGNVFKAGSASNEYIFSFFIHNQALGLLLMPIVVFGAFSRDIPLHVCIYIGIAMIFSMYLYRVAKSFIAALSGSGISLFYLFLYLCAIEVVPSVFIAKVILNNMVRQ